MEEKKFVYVMNEYTYKIFEETTQEKAFEQEDPIEYLLLMASISVIIDNGVADNMVEVYDEEIYREMVEGE